MAQGLIWTQNILNLTPTNQDPTPLTFDNFSQYADSTDLNRTGGPNNGSKYGDDGVNGGDIEGLIAHTALTTNSSGQCNEDGPLSCNVVLMTDGGINGSTKRMRFNYFDCTNQPSLLFNGNPTDCSRCGNSGHGIIRWIPVPFQKKIWYSKKWKFSPGYRMGGDPSWQNCISGPFASGAEFKWDLFGITTGGGRYGMECFDAQWNFGFPNNSPLGVFGISNPPMLPAQLVDGKIHELRYAIFTGTTATSADSYVSIWIDDIPLLVRRNVVSGTDGLFSACLFNTRNQGMSGDNWIDIYYWGMSWGTADPSLTSSRWIIPSSNVG